jgi:glutamate racemase
VLGCTHYPFLRPAIERIVGGGVAVIDPAPAVARQTGHVLARIGMEAGRDSMGRHRFYTTGGVGAFQTMMRRLLPAYGEQSEVKTAFWEGKSLES